MTESTQSRLAQGCIYPALGELPRRLKVQRAELALGAAAAAAAALFVCFHWTIGLVGAVTVFALSAIASERFLLLVIALLPFSWILRAELPVRDVMLMARLLVVAGFLAGCAWRGSVKARRLLEPSITRAALFFAAVAAVSVALASGGWTHESIRDLSRLASFIGFYVVIFMWADSAQRIRRIGLVLLVCVIVLSLFAIFQEISGGYTSLWGYFNPPDEFIVPWSNRAPSLTPYSNVLASCLNLILPFALACFALGEGRWKRTGMLAMGLGVVALLCTQSLGGLVSFGCVAVLATFCFVRRLWKRLALLAGTGALALGFFMAREFLNPAHGELAFGYDVLGRALMWGAAWDTFQKSPLLGVGWGNFISSYSPELSLLWWMPPPTPYANNLYLDLLSGVGVIGFISFSVLAFLAIRQAYRTFQSSVHFLGKALGFGVMGAMATSLIHGWIDDPLLSTQAGGLWWTMLGLLVAYSRLEARENWDKQRGVVS